MKALSSRLSPRHWNTTSWPENTSSENTLKHVEDCKDRAEMQKHFFGVLRVQTWQTVLFLSMQDKTHSPEETMMMAILFRFNTSDTGCWTIYTPHIVLFYNILHHKTNLVVNNMQLFISPPENSLSSINSSEYQETFYQDISLRNESPSGEVTLC